MKQTLIRNACVSGLFRIMLLGALVAETATLVAAESYDFMGAFQLTIPEDFEVLSLSQSFDSLPDLDQYDLRATFEIAYGDAYLPLTVDVAGSADLRLAAGRIGLQGEPGRYYNPYRLPIQAERLHQKYELQPGWNRNGIRYARFVSAWPSGSSADYYGVYFRTDDTVFPEVLISVFNAWSAFHPSELLLTLTDDPSFEEKLARQSASARTFFALLQEIVESVAKAAQMPARRLTLATQFWTYTPQDGFLTPVAENVRLRALPATSARIIGYVPKTLHRVVGVGRTETIDGRAGRWVRIVPVFGTTIGWAFDAYLRKATDKETIEFFEAR